MTSFELREQQIRAALGDLPHDPTPPDPEDTKPNLAPPAPYIRGETDADAFNRELSR